MAEKIHKVAPTLFVQPTKCSACLQSMWMKSKCAKCEDCGLKFHEGCILELPVTCKRKTKDGKNARLKIPGKKDGATDRPQTLRAPSIVVRCPSDLDVSAPNDPHRFYNAPVMFTDAIEEHSSDEEKKKTVNQYTVHEVLGRGAFGVVRRVTSKQDKHKQNYAMKEMSKKMLQRKRYGVGNAPMRNAMEDVKKEVAILKRIAHPNIIKLIEVLDDPKKDTLFLVFEKGDDVVMKLGDAGTQVKPLSKDMAWRYFRDLLNGMSYLHSCQIVHRDIKPDNLLVKDGRLKITDFGVSEIMTDKNGMLTRSVGSAAFWAPEMCSAEATEYMATPLDIWAMGVTLYAFNFGCVPFSGQSAMTLFENIKDQEVPIPEGCDEDLADILRRMLDKDPKTRATIEELVEHPYTTHKGADPLVLTSGTTIERTPSGRFKLSEEDTQSAFTAVRKRRDDVKW